MIDPVLCGLFSYVDKTDRNERKSINYTATYEILMGKITSIEASPLLPRLSRLRRLKGFHYFLSRINVVDMRESCLFDSRLYKKVHGTGVVLMERYWTWKI